MKASSPRKKSDRVPKNAAQVVAPEGGDTRLAGSTSGAALNARVQIILGVLLFLIVAGLFLPAVSHGFITYDDPRYVTENVHVKSGLTWANVRWAFESTEASNWHPLTWLSYLADDQVFGLQPWGFHLTNVLLHALNAALVFVVLRKMTGAPWRSLFVAALFGLHPLHVESVAWISERKDVLSTVFLLLALWAYARRAELIRARAPGARIQYGLALLFFALGLMSKPMLVTLPCILLLLDYWPLNRWSGISRTSGWMLLVEKIPFFALSVASSAVTLFAQAQGQAVGSVEDFTWPVRIATALVAYCQYLGKCFWPAKLAIFYPNFAEMPSYREIFIAVTLLGGITVAVAMLIRRQPWLLVGWLWFVGTLVPVIGLVQVGGQSLADRYSYVPLIGVFVMVAWAAGVATVAWTHRHQVLGVAAGAVLFCCVTLTHRQLGYWKDGVTLFRHNLDVTENNWVAHANLYGTLARTSPAEARVELQETVRILAAFAEKYDQKGLALAQLPGRSADAIKQFRTAIRIMQDIPGPHYNLGLMLAQTPDSRTEAVEELRAAIRLQPNFAEAHFSLGVVLSEMPGRATEAAAEYQTAISLQPDSFQAHYNLGLLLMDMPQRSGEALGHFQAALRAKPDLEQAREMIKRLQPASP
jgi:tetratricopeptide (TPR) repeat protein